MWRAALLLIAFVPAARAGDPELGRKLVAEHKCETCHQNKTMGEPGAIYLRKDRHVTSLGKLRAQVAACNSQLGLQIFPEDEEHIVAFLNREYYKFPAK